MMRIGMADDLAGVEVVRSDSVSPIPEKMYEGDLICKGGIDRRRNRYPHCVVWTPIPLITWLFPFIGHMGICTTVGVIRDFAGPYFVSEDSMGFGNPTKYWQLSLDKVPSANPKETWDRGVHDASEEYKGRMHNLCCDNCHSHVAYALNTMNYDKSTSWNMFTLTFLMLVRGKHVSVMGFIKTWLPFTMIAAVTIAIVLFFKA